METKVAQPKWEVMNLTEEIRSALPSFHPVMAQLLWQRGVRTAEEAEKFLHPDYDHDLHDPFLFSGMEKAVQRIFWALEKNERITVHGDYDADGVSGGAVLTTTLQELARAMKKELRLDFYVPHREKEGYGLHKETIDLLREQGTNLIITVDCGIANCEAVARAKEYGLDTIVVDHHDFKEDLPDAILIHPRLPGENYPFPFLAATGVAWKLAVALLTRAREQGFSIAEYFEKWLLDLVAIATVTDMVPLRGENRVLEHFGLKVLKKTQRLGLQKLFEMADIRKEKITTTTIGFQIGPRINAAGRMEHAEAAFRLLIASDPEEASVLAQKLHEQNTVRQQETKRIFAEARVQVLERREDCLFWAVGNEWPAGLVGLVAGKLSQEFARPVLVMGRVGERVVGSGRGVAGFHITEALQELGDYLEHFGGHPQACGFTIFGEENFSSFVKGIVQIGNAKLKDKELAPQFVIDAKISLNDLNWDFINQIILLAPHGEQNPMPKFLSQGLVVEQFDLVGETGKHLRLHLSDGQGILKKFIAFGFGERVRELERGTKIDVVYEIGINEWNGREEMEYKVVDFRPAN